MIEYRNYPNNNIIELTVEGEITEADFASAIARIKTDIQNHGKLRMLEDIRSFEGIDPTALWQDAQFGLAHVNDFTHVAIIADAEWMRTFAAAAGNLLSARVKAFEPSQTEAARAWLLTAPDSAQLTGLEYKRHEDSNVVELVVEGKITAASFDDFVRQAEADFEKHGKLRILEEIRSFEGIDPIAFWHDLQYIRRINDVTHAAIVADAKWMRSLTEAIKGFYPFEVRAFERSQIEEARTWLKTA